ncbi:hypothetical protein H7X87_04295 [Acetobacteraceae bacterium]|nr:hypothetical protein [Candidatus Parcubacteria bacterium]
MKDIVILYHGNCPDGFAAAFAAWKKFKNEATYIPVFHGEPMPGELDGKEIYMVDFSYPQEQLLDLEKRAKRFVVLDHHSGAREAVEKVKEHVFDNDRSGAGISWGYFHPDAPLPRLLAYIQDNDLWRKSLPNGKEVAAFLGTVKFDFDTFDKLLSQFENEKEFAVICGKGRSYREYFEFVVEDLIEKAEEVQFDEYTIYAVNAPRLFRSELGNRLATLHPPFSIIWYQNHGMWHFSMRGDGSVDLSEVAKRYGGNGHHNAASFRLPLSKPFPFTPTHSS